MRVPLVLCGPGLAANQRNDALVYLHDVMPTTCEFAGIPIPETVESRSLGPLLRGGAGGYESVFGAYMQVQRMVRKGSWKLIRYPQVNVTQLFDLQADPWEMKSVADDPQNVDRIEELTEELREWQRVTHDRLEV
jgi:arylsulfatase A-like enzyme